MHPKISGKIFIIHFIINNYVLTYYSGYSAAAVMSKVISSSTHKGAEQLYK